MALGHRWPWDQVGGARVGRGTVALRYLGCLPTITSSISGVKDAQRSRRQSIWAVYTSLRHTAKYTGFGCISYVYSPLASSRLACQDIQRIQHIQPIQPYSHTRHTSYSAIQPPSGSLGAVICELLPGGTLRERHMRVIRLGTKPRIITIYNGLEQIVTGMV